MSNLMSNIYIGLVAEIIKENGEPTLDIRVRIPSLHVGLENKDLPIAKPILIPGMAVNKTHFLEYFNTVNRVYIMFDSGSKATPRYFGAISEGNSTVDVGGSVEGFLPFVNLTVTTIPETAQKTTVEEVLFKSNVLYLIRFENGTTATKPTLNGISIQLGATDVEASLFTVESNAIIPMFYDIVTNTLKLTGSYGGTGELTLADVAYSGDYDDLLNKPDLSIYAEESWVINQHYATEADITDLLSDKVDKVEGKGLSTNDYTDTDKLNVEKIPTIEQDLAEHILDVSNPHGVTKGQIGLPNVPNINATNPENIVQNSSYRFVTDAEKSNWNSKTAIHVGYNEPDGQVYDMWYELLEDD